MEQLQEVHDEPNGQKSVRKRKPTLRPDGRGVAVQIDDSELETTTSTVKTPVITSNELYILGCWCARAFIACFNAGVRALVFILKSLLYYVQRHTGHATVVFVLLFSIAILAGTGYKVQEQMISDRLLDATVARLAEASRFTRNHRSTDSGAPGREFLRVGGPLWMQHAAIKAILEESRAVGLSIEDQAVLLATAEVESGFNPMARASTTTACGLFQFVKRTGLAYDLSRQDCMDPHANAAAGIRHYLANYQARVEEKVADLSGAEQLHRIFELSYYLHHDGPESTTHSDAVKAVVLLGTPYLFRAYEILRTEEQQRASYPSFSDEVAKEFRAVTANASVHLPVSLRGALSDDKSISGGNDGDVPSAEDFADIKHSTQGS